MISGGPDTFYCGIENITNNMYYLWVFLQILNYFPMHKLYLIIFSKLKFKTVWDMI